jgi:hypothetical protein
MIALQRISSADDGQVDASDLGNGREAQALGA